MTRLPSANRKELPLPQYPEVCPLTHTSPATAAETSKGG